MLKQLLIQNIAIIGYLALDFKRGLTVITGESGSGKSILLDAVSLAFGAKASPRDVLRAGCERGSVELLFDIGSYQDHAGLSEFLARQNVTLLPEETEILLSREFTSGGSRSRINGVPVTRDVLEELRPWVLDLHGQHELTSLFQRDRQRGYLDAFGGSGVLTLKRRVADAYEDWLDARQRWEEAKTRQQAFLQQQDFMIFQWKELNEASLEEPDEDSRLRQELEVLGHAEKLLRLSAKGTGMLSEGDPQTPAILDQLSQLEKTLSDGAGYDDRLQEILEQVRGLHTDLRAVASDLVRYHERLESDPARMAELGDRLDLLEKLKRKYGATLMEVIAKRGELAEALQNLEESGQNLAALEADATGKEAALRALSLELSQLRRELADNLKARLLEQLEVLAMPGVSFDVTLQPAAYSREGMDEVEFLFSANPGEPLKPLAKVASGGELSRFLLAMKVLTAQSDGLLTLVFDEIDTGISGPTAKAVAEKLLSLSGHLQVLTITHQPMIAAIGQQHLHVEKQIVKTETGEETVSVEVEMLEADEEKRLRMLSRLISGTDAQDEAVEKFIRRLQEQAAAFSESARPLKVRQSG